MAHPLTHRSFIQAASIARRGQTIAVPDPKTDAMNGPAATPWPYLLADEPVFC